MEVCLHGSPLSNEEYAGMKAMFDPKSQDLDMTAGFGRDGIVVSLHDGLGEPDDRMVQVV